MTITLTLDELLGWTEEERAKWLPWFKANPAAMAVTVQPGGRFPTVGALVDHILAHALGLAVILDVVYNHFGPEGNYLPHYGPYLTDIYKTPWGSAVNYDGPDSTEVRRFVIENAMYWVHDFHVDGLRLDATHAIIDDSPRHIVAELTAAVHAAAAEQGLVQDKVAVTRKAREAAIAKRLEPLTGTSEYPDIAEAALKVLDVKPVEANVFERSAASTITLSSGPSVNRSPSWDSAAPRTPNRDRTPGCTGGSRWPPAPAAAPIPARCRSPPRAPAARSRPRASGRSRNRPG